jgi:carbamoyltransferase
VSRREMDIAASIQQVTEEVMLRTVRHAHRITGSKNLVMAGGVALNCVGNGRIAREGPFERMWIQPAAGDAGGALGAALFVWHQLLGNARRVEGADAQRASLLGPSYDSTRVRSFLDSAGARYHHLPEEDALLGRVADLLAGERVVGHFAGPMEFGPRALGNRSILGDARSREMQSVMNLKIKFRESFRPFAPIVMRDHAAEYFDMRADLESPYMLIVAPVREGKRVAANGTAAGGIERVKEVRSVVPAVTHVDYSARIQTVDPERNRRLHALMERFRAKTGCPVLINTSFNVRGEPIVCTPEDAYRCFMATDMDALVLEDLLLLKEEQPENPEYDRARHLARFRLD